MINEILLDLTNAINRFTGMNDILSEWRYTTSLPGTRRTQLLEPTTFAQLIERVLEDVTVTGLKAKPGSDPGLTDCIQPVFTIDLPNTGDALFNGPWGCRAQYWRHPAQGLAANAKILSALARTKAIERGKPTPCPRTRQN